MKKALIVLVIGIAMFVGEVKCIIKMINCNFEPIGKAEIFYTIGTFTWAGCVIGYIDIKDN